MFLHVGALLATIMTNNTQQRPQRTIHSAVIAPALILMMVSNHFPLIYGDTRAWLVAPVVVATGCLAGLSLDWLSNRSRLLQQA